MNRKQVWLGVVLAMGVSGCMGEETTETDGDIAASSHEESCDLTVTSRTLTSDGANLCETPDAEFVVRPEGCDPIERPDVIACYEGLALARREIREPLAVPAGDVVERIQFALSTEQFEYDDVFIVALEGCPDAEGNREAVPIAVSDRRLNDYMEAESGSPLDRRYSWDAIEANRIDNQAAELPECIPGHSECDIAPTESAGPVSVVVDLPNLAPYDRAVCPNQDGDRQLLFVLIGDEDGREAVCGFNGALAVTTGTLPSDCHEDQDDETDEDPDDATWPIGWISDVEAVDLSGDGLDDLVYVRQSRPLFDGLVRPDVNTVEVALKAANGEIGGFEGRQTLVAPGEPVDGRITTNLGRAYNFVVTDLPPYDGLEDIVMLGSAIQVLRLGGNFSFIHAFRHNPDHTFGQPDPSDPSGRRRRANRSWSLDFGAHHIKAGDWRDGPEDELFLYGGYQGVRVIRVGFEGELEFLEDLPFYAYGTDMEFGDLNNDGLNDIVYSFQLGSGEVNGPQILRPETQRPNLVQIMYRGESEPIDVNLFTAAYEYYPNLPATADVVVSDPGSLDDNVMFPRATIFDPSVAIGDITGNGLNDLAIATHLGVYLLYNPTGAIARVPNDQGRFEHQVTELVEFDNEPFVRYGSNNRWRPLELTDTDADGDVDLLVTRGFSGSRSANIEVPSPDEGINGFEVLAQQADGSFAYAAPFGSDSTRGIDLPEAISLGDFDGDGVPEAVRPIYEPGSIPITVIDTSPGYPVEVDSFYLRYELMISAADGRAETLR